MASLFNPTGMGGQKISQGTTQDYQLAGMQVPQGATPPPPPPAPPAPTGSNWLGSAAKAAIAPAQQSLAAGYGTPSDTGGAPSGGPSASPNAAATTAGQAPQPYLEDLYKQFGSAYMSPTYTGQAMGGLQDQLKGPGQAEQFYQQAQNTATDPYYQRLQQQGMDALNQQMAARGHFNSGGALAGLGNFQSGLAAQQYHQMGDLANQAQTQMQARTGLSGQLANNADQVDLNRLNGLFTQANAAQSANQQFINSMLGQQMGIDQTGAGLEGQFYGQGGQLSGQSMSDAINAGVNAAQAGAGGQQARQKLGMGVLQGLLGGG